MKTIALIVEYDGGLYKGFQNQTDAPTIQNTIEMALNMLTNEDIETLWVIFALYGQTTIGLIHFGT